MRYALYSKRYWAPLVELVDTLVLGTSAARHGGSSPSRGTRFHLICGSEAEANDIEELPRVLFANQSCAICLGGKVAIGLVRFFNWQIRGGNSVG